MNKTKFLVLFSLFFLLSLISCDPDSLVDIPDDIVSGTTLNIHLTDGPIDLEEVNIDLRQVLVKGPGGFEEIPLGTKAGIYNLLDYQNGIDTLIANTELELTRITEVRLVLGDNNTVVVDGESFDLKIPSGNQSGLKIKVCLDLTNTPQYDLLLDFDAAASIHQTGNGKYIMRPVIRVMNSDAKCTDDDDDDTDDDSDDDGAELPANVIEWLEANYSGYEFKADKDAFCGNEVYEVVATTDQDTLYLYFDLDGNFLQSAVMISNDELPEAVTTAIGTDYSDFTPADGPTFRIENTEATILYRARVENADAKLDVVYQEDGSLFCDDAVSEEDDDDEGTLPGDLPQEVIDYLTDTYAGYHFGGIAADTLCDGKEVYILEGGKGSHRVWLYFDLDWNLLQSSEPLAEKDLPEAVTASIATGYAEYKIMNNQAWEITKTNGDLWYRVYLKKNNSSKKIYVIYAEDGTFICEEE